MCQLGPSIFLIFLSAETGHNGLELKKKTLERISLISGLGTLHSNTYSMLYSLATVFEA